MLMLIISPWYVSGTRLLTTHAFSLLICMVLRCLPLLKIDYLVCIVFHRTEEDGWHGRTHGGHGWHLSGAGESMSRCKWPNNCSSCSHKFDIMKFIIAIVAVSSFSGTTLAFAPSASSRIATALNAKVGIYYSTQTGNCEIVAEYIAQAAGLEFADIGDVSDDMILGLGTSISTHALYWYRTILVFVS